MLYQLLLSQTPKALIINVLFHEAGQQMFPNDSNSSDSVHKGK